MSSSMSVVGSPWAVMSDRARRITEKLYLSPQRVKSVL